MSEDVELLELSYIAHGNVKRQFLMKLSIRQFFDRILFYVFIQKKKFVHKKTYIAVFIAALFAIVKNENLVLHSQNGLLFSKKTKQKNTREGKTKVKKIKTLFLIG